MRRLTTLALLLAVHVPAAPLLAQTPPSEPAAGERVRLTIRDRWGRNRQAVYTVVRATPDTIFVTNASLRAPVPAPVASLRRVEVSRGRRSRAAGLGRGLVIGLVAGGLVGTGVGLAVSEGGDEGPVPPAAGTIVFGGAGAIAGSLIGVILPGERWRRVPLVPRLDARPGPNGRTLVGLTRTF